MRVVVAAIGSVLVGFAAVAGETDGWRQLNGVQIEAALDGRSLQYEAATQVFYKSGKTLYDAGHPSWGAWRIQGDRYCSEWPPNAGWDCYNFDQRVDAETGSIEMRFISDTGHETRATYTE